MLTYVLSKGFTGELKYPLYFRPVIEPGYFFFEAACGLAIPHITDSLHFSCMIAYKGFAKQAFTGNSFFANENSRTFNTNMERLSNSFFCAGDYRTKTVQFKDGHKVVMAITGRFLFSDSVVFSSISNTIFQERKFWNDPGSAYFFTALLPLTDNGIVGGTAHFNSFFMAQSTGLGDITRGFLPILSHEYFHTWIGLGLKNPGPDELNKWFSEGFTDYYSIKLLYTVMGTISKNDFISKINKCLQEYYFSPYFTTDNKELLGRYWENPQLKALSYRRGLAIAFMLDNKIAEKGAFSLDDLMKSLYKQSSPKFIFSKGLFDRLVSEYAGSEIVSDINNINEGKNDRLTQNLLNNKVCKISDLPVNKFDIGFDLEASKSAKKIIGLKQGSNAWKAGLAENMEITNNFSIWNNNTEKPLKVQVVRDGKTEWITYIPAMSVLVPQIVKDAG